MDRVWVNCFAIPTGLLRGEHMYRVRRHDGTIVEGYAGRVNIQPTWHHVIQRKSKKRNQKEITALWGRIEADAIQRGPEKTLVALPDDQVVLVKNSRIHSAAVGQVL